MEINKQEKKTQKIIVRITDTEKNNIKNIIAKRKINESNFLRECIEMGMNIQSYHDNLKFIQKVIAQLFDNKLDTFLNNMKEIEQKHAMSIAINTYLCAGTIEKLLPDFRQQAFKEVLQASQKQAIMYVNKKIEGEVREKDILDYYRWGDLYSND